MELGRNLIINWLIKSKAIKDDEREQYEYAPNSIVLLISPAIISITIGCIMGIPVDGIEESINIINGIMYDDTNVNTSYGGDK